MMVEHKKRDTESYVEWLYRLIHEYGSEVRKLEAAMLNAPALDDKQQTRLFELYAALYAYELCAKTYESEEEQS